MRISEAHSFTRKSVAIRRRRLTAGMRKIAVAQIIGKDVDHIRSIFRVEDKNRNANRKEKSQRHAQL